MQPAWETKPGQLKKPSSNTSTCLAMGRRTTSIDFIWTLDPNNLFELSMSPLCAAIGVNAHLKQAMDRFPLPIGAIQGCVGIDTGVGQ